MDDSERPATSAARPDRRWLATADLVLAGGTVLVAAIWIGLQDAEAAVVMGATLIPLVVLTAAAFVLAHRALTHGWNNPWLWQVAGPALLALMVFGAAWALVAALLVALAGWFFLRR